MPIRVQDELPAVNFLREENVFVMTTSRASGQEIRPLKVLILNLMPCVFPILSLKILQLIEGYRRRLKRKTSSCAYCLTHRYR